MGRKLLFGLLLALCSAVPAAAQAIPDSVPADTIPRESNAPRSAFIKSLILPGWGQFSIGEPVRGTFWVAVQGSSYYMLVKTLGRLSEAKDRYGNYRAASRLAVLERMETDTVLRKALENDELAFDAEVHKDTLTAAALDLVESRTRHRQDWITYTLFFTMLDGLDAYVAAHLKDFPASITTEVDPERRVSLRVEVPITGRRYR